MINREYPHQVLLPAENVGGKKLDMVIVFHAQIDAKQQARSVRKDDRWYQVYCFAEAEQARAFQAIFGGELVRD